MTRKVVFMSALGVCLIGFLVTIADAQYSIKSGGTYWCHYKLWYDIAGGQKPDTNTTFLASDIHVLEGALACKNPGTNQKDVRVGKGGISVWLYTSANAWKFDNRGRTTALQDLPADVDYIYDNKEINNIENKCYQNLDCSQNAFEELWGVSVLDCRNSNWLPYQYLMSTFYQTGIIYKDCNEDLTDCAEVDDLELWCSTDEQYNSWAADEKVTYYCVEVGTPIAFDDFYSIGKNKKLTVKAPGVLLNDRDLEGDILRVATVNKVVDYVGGSVVTDCGGSLTVNGDGSFSYTAPTVACVDSFTYQATDCGEEFECTKISNDAVVTITVK